MAPESQCCQPPSATPNWSQRNLIAENLLKKSTMQPPLYIGRNFAGSDFWMAKMQCIGFASFSCSKSRIRILVL